MPAKFTGDSLLIREFTYSLFIGFCLVTSDMTGYSHSIKLIHCGAPQRNILNDKMMFWVVIHSFYVMLCQSYLLGTVISFFIQRQIVVTHIFYFILCQSPLLRLRGTVIGSHFQVNTKVQTAMCKDNNNSKSRAATSVKFDIHTQNVIGRLYSVHKIFDF